MQAQSIFEAQVQQPRMLAMFCNVKLLLGGYLGISVLTLAAIVVLRDNSAIAPMSVWIRNAIVVIHGLAMLAFANRMARGSRVGYILLRLGTAVMVVAIGVVLAIPGDFPLWFKIEQGFCGLLLLRLVLLISRKQVRAVFAKTNN